MMLHCNQAFPQMREEWKELLAQLQQEPARVAYSPPDKRAVRSQSKFELSVFAEKIAAFGCIDEIGESSGSTLIHQAAHGDFASFFTK